MKSKKEICLIIGRAKTGKSSLCRCLTGVSKFSTVNLSYINNQNIATFVHPRSLQEIEINVKSAIALISQRNAAKYILTLRFNAFNSCESAIEYVKAFRKMGWNITGIVFLGETEIDEFPGINNIIIENSRDTTINSIAVEARNVFELI